MIRTPRLEEDLLGLGGRRTVGALGEDACAWIRGAFSTVIWFSSAAGIRMSQSQLERRRRSASSRAPGKSRIEPVSAQVLRDGLDVEAVCAGRWRRRAPPARRSGRRPPGRTWRRGSRRCRVPARPRACPSSPGESPSALHVVRVGARLAEAEEDAAPGRLRAAADAALGDRLARHAGQGVDLPRVEGGVGVGDPRHLARRSVP